ncbi:type VI secretion system-associated FHA domain protein TagH [Enterovibrio norvegicus]|uniref:type VI secretion system-associated FHA domain protein TagH n=1 Tax=Enterovibrio norvegicus TaxID=188144 RepID=UPI0024B281E6|nr:type VI secretion system-associated FHA domain protein TagH [Enterovibrio norvegicus]
MSQQLTDASETSSKQQVLLVVTNTQFLEAGLSAKHTFTHEGGSIGASEADDWYLRDREGRVFTHHAEILSIDGELCLLDVRGACYMNGATIPVGGGKPVRLNENDVVLIGPYKIRIHLVEAGQEVVSGQHGLEQVFFSEPNALDIGSEKKHSDKEPPEDDVIDDPLAALDALTAASLETSPLDDEIASSSPAQDKEDYLLARDTEWHGSEKTVHADSEYEMSSAITLKKSLMNEEYPMDDKTLERLEEEVGRNFSENTKGEAKSDYSNSDYAAGAGADYGTSGAALPDDANHLVVGPILRGLGAQAGNAGNMAEMQALSEEMGASLQAAIRGLLELHTQVEESRYGMMNKNLQPIEDNPLRLGLDYKNTVETMYDRQRSAVHLSAPSAISESLTNVRHHNEAVQIATTEALTQILRALSPDVLMRRFSAYRRPGETTPESADAWAWNMYKSYYGELTSDRQKGFEKLFWEIFDQAYDRKLREKQLEV